MSWKKEQELHAHTDMDQHQNLILTSAMATTVGMQNHNWWLVMTMNAAKLLQLEHSHSVTFQKF